MLGPVAAGFYSVAQRATLGISQPAQLLGQAAYAELARLLASGGGGASIRRALGRMIGVATALVPPALLLIVLAAHPLAELIGGPAFRGAAISCLSWPARTILLAGPAASAALVAFGRPGLSVAANLLSSIGLLPLPPPLMTALNLTGAGIHALIQAVVAAALLG